MAENQVPQDAARGKIALLRVDLTARPLGERPTGYWWLTTGELIGAQLEEALAVRRGLAARVAPVAGGAEAEAAMLEWGGHVHELRRPAARRPGRAAVRRDRLCDPRGPDRATCRADCGSPLRLDDRRGDPGGSGARLLGHCPRRDRAGAVFLLTRPARREALQ